MKLRSIILILGLLSQVSFMMAQSSEPSVTDWFRSSHLKCENAYKYNNYAVMELSLHERKNAIAEGRLKGLSREDSVEVLGMYHKDRGSYHACLAYMDGSSYSQAKECFEKSMEILPNDSAKEWLKKAKQKLGNPITRFFRKLFSVFGKKK